MACGHASCTLLDVFFLVLVDPVSKTHGADVLCYVNDAFKRSYFYMPRSRF